MLAIRNDDELAKVYSSSIGTGAIIGAGVVPSAERESDRMANSFLSIPRGVHTDEEWLLQVVQKGYFRGSDKAHVGGGGGGGGEGASEGEGGGGGGGGGASEGEGEGKGEGEGGGEGGGESGAQEQQEDTDQGEGKNQGVSGEGASEGAGAVAGTDKSDAAEFEGSLTAADRLTATACVDCFVAAMGGEEGEEEEEDDGDKYYDHPFAHDSPEFDNGIYDDHNNWRLEFAVDRVPMRVARRSPPASEGGEATEGQRKGKKGVHVRRRRIVRNSIQGITKRMIKALAARAGVLALDPGCYEELRRVLQDVLQEPIRVLDMLCTHRGAGRGPDGPRYISDVVDMCMSGHTDPSIALYGTGMIGHCMRTKFREPVVPQQHTGSLCGQAASAGASNNKLGGYFYDWEARASASRAADLDWLESNDCLAGLYKQAEDSESGFLVLDDQGLVEERDEMKRKGDRYVDFVREAPFGNGVLAMHERSLAFIKVMQATVDPVLPYKPFMLLITEMLGNSTSCGHLRGSCDFVWTPGAVRAMNGE